MSTDLQAEAAEALCSALYRLPFSEFVGERDIDGGHEMFFHLGQHPRDIRVTVIRPADPSTVLVRIQWRNLHCGVVLAGSQTLTISTYMATRSQVAETTQSAILRVLEVYKDVLEGTGVAGPLDALQEPADEPEEETRFPFADFDPEATVAPQDTEGGAPQ